MRQTIRQHSIVYTWPECNNCASWYRRAGEGGATHNVDYVESVPFGTTKVPIRMSDISAEPAYLKLIFIAIIYASHSGSAIQYYAYRSLQFASVNVQ